jgi:hypothetical protein
MTWITNLENRINKQYDITPNIKPAFGKRYGKNHRADFWFINDNIEFDTNWHRLYNKKDFHKSFKLKKYLRSNADIKVRSEWGNDFVYFDDLDEFLSSTPKEFHEYIHSLEVMDPRLVKAQQCDLTDPKNEVTFCKKLPFDKYRYQVYIVTSANERDNIGHDNLLHLRLSIEAYDGIKVNDTFRESHTHKWWVPETYFYSESLDWLPMIRLMEPRYIRKIKQFKTLGEIKNENSS